MNAKNPQNPTNSSVVQMCLDAAKAGHPELLEALQAIKEKDPRAIKDIDGIWNSHKHPDNSLAWVKFKNFEKCRAISNLSKLSGGDKAKSLLLAMIQIVNQDMYVQCSHNIIGKIVSQSKPTVIKCIDTLIQYGFIVVAKKATNKDAAVYMINPNVVTVGKTEDDKLLEKFNELVALADSEQQPLKNFLLLEHMNNNIKTTFTKYIDDDGEVVFYNSWFEEAKEKKPTHGGE